MLTHQHLMRVLLKKGNSVYVCCSFWKKKRMNELSPKRWRNASDMAKLKWKFEFVVPPINHSLFMGKNPWCTHHVKWHSSLRALHLRFNSKCMAAIELADGFIIIPLGWFVHCTCSRNIFFFLNVLMARNVCSSHAIVIVLTNIIIIVCDSIAAHLKWKPEYVRMNKTTRYETESNGMN